MASLSDNAKLLERLLPESLEFIPDSLLRENSGLHDPEYSMAKQELVEAGRAKIGRGRGGPIRRHGTLKQQILSKLPRDGSFISNNKIYEPIGLSPEEFANVQEQLIAEGRVKVGRGRYGRTALTHVEENNGFYVDYGVSNEKELYEPVKAYFDRKWKPNYEPSPPNLYISKITARQTKRRMSWSVPDISMLTLMKYDFVPGTHLELITMEIKRQAELNIEDVYKTASHSIFSHRAYLVFEWVEDTDFEKSGPDAEFLIAEAKRFGIGLVRMKPKNHNEWEFKQILDPRLHMPETGELNSFIEVRFEEDHVRIRGAID